MSLATVFLRQAARPRLGPEPADLSVADGAWALECQVLDQSSFACSVLGFRIRRAGGGPWQPEEVERHARAIAERVDFLLERLSFIEADRISGTALVRSSAAALRGATKDYYEFTVSRDGLVGVERRRHAAGTRGSRPVPLVLTNEFLEKLITTLQAVMSGA